MNYTEEEMELYSIYMDYVREVVRQDEVIPEYIRKVMLSGKTLQKVNDTTWSLEVVETDDLEYYVNPIKHSVTFMSFNAWRKCEERDKRLDAILEKLDAIRNV